MSHRNGAVVILVATPDEESAERVARSLVEDRLAACVNTLPGVRSVYRWRGSVEVAGEVLLVVKARREDVESIAQRVQQLHPYEVPEVIALDIVEGHAPYLEWLRVETDRG
jgi:periplasmic divalent cation tolerance protein